MSKPHVHKWACECRHNQNNTHSNTHTQNKITFRYGHVLNHVASDTHTGIIFFGGDDGSHKTSPNFYRGNYYDDIWILQKQNTAPQGRQNATWTWRHVNSNSFQTALVPEARTACASFVHGSCMYMAFGFSGRALGDIWRLCFSLDAGFMVDLHWENLTTAVNSHDPDHHHGDDERMPLPRYQVRTQTVTLSIFIHGKQ